MDPGLSLAQELQATREVMRLREELRQRERDIEFEHRLDRFAVSGAPTQAPTAAVPPLHMTLHRDDAAIEVGTSRQAALAAGCYAWISPCPCMPAVCSQSACGRCCSLLCEYVCVRRLFPAVCACCV